MYGNKSETTDAETAAKETQAPTAQQSPLPARTADGTVPIMPSRRSVIRPEVVRRSADYHSSGTDSDMTIGNYSDGKKLIVERDIALSGSINACEKLVVEGRVEASISDCQEIEVAETGTFKGEAEIDVAEISGVFEGTLIARELLLVRNTGRITGNIRFGRLEVERGGKIEGDVGVFTAKDQNESGTV